MQRLRSDSVTSAKGEGRKKKSLDPLTVLIISTKPGNRMKSQGAPLLLPMSKSRCLLDIHINSIKAVDANSEIILCCGFEVDKVSEYVKSHYKNQRIRIVENQLFDKTSCCESLRISLNNVTSNRLLVLNGEVVTYPEIFKIRRESPYILNNKKTKEISSFEIGSVCDENDLVTNISFGLPSIWTEIFYLHSGETIETLRKIVCNENYKTKLIFEALNTFNRTKYNFYQQVIKEKIIKIDSLKTYQKVKHKYENTNSQLFVRNFN